MHAVFLLSWDSAFRWWLPYRACFSALTYDHGLHLGAGSLGDDPKIFDEHPQGFGSTLPQSWHVVAVNLHRLGRPTSLVKRISSQNIQSTAPLALHVSRTTLHAPYSPLC